MSLALAALLLAIALAQAPQATAAGSGHVLGSWVYNHNDSTVTNKHSYRRFSQDSYTFAAGDHVEYDVHLIDCVPRAGGLDVNATNIGPLRNYSWYDLNGLQNIGADLTATSACSGWYHRVLPVPAEAIGQTATEWFLVGENDDYRNGVAYRTQYDNIEVTDGAGNPRPGGVIFADRGDFSWDDVTEQYTTGDADHTIAATNLDGDPEPDPTVESPTFPTDDYVVSGFDAGGAPYNADSTGATDATAAIQRALDDAFTSGGGVVWLPAGFYKVTESINIPPHVTLRGDWRDPDASGTSYGTVIMAETAAGSATDPGLLRVWGGAGINGLTVFYPDQDASSPTAYPYTIEIVGYLHGTGDGAFGSTVERVTLLNSYRGLGSGTNEQWNQLTLIRNLKGTVLSSGLFFQNAVDITRTEDVTLEPAYWADIGSAIPGATAPASGTIASWTRANGTGLTLLAAEQDDFVNVTLSDYETGVHLSEGGRGALNTGNFFGLNVHNSHIGFLAESVDPQWGVNIARSVIEADQGASPVAVKVDTDNGSGNQVPGVLIKDSTLGGGAETALLVDGDSYVDCHSCTFDDWSGTYAVVANAGTTAIESSDFTPTLGGSKKGVLLNSGVTSAVLFADRYTAAGTGPGYLYDSFTSGDVAWQDDSPPGFTFHPGAPSYSFQAVPRPASDRLFDADDYGAGTTDDTSAIQEALDAAGTPGGGKSGGTVLLRPGIYSLSGHLSVPAGVELRGSDEATHRPNENGPSTGTILLVREGKGTSTPDADAAFITLDGDGAGVRGLSVHYPEQNTSPSTIAAYPWTIRGDGSDVYVHNVSMSNAFQGIDFASNATNGHHISVVTGMAMKTAIKVGNATHGRIEDTHFSINGWSETNGMENGSISENQASTNPSIWNFVLPYLQANQHVIVVEDGAADEHLVNNFVFGTNFGLEINDTAVVTAINSGQDFSLQPITIRGTGASGAVLTNVLSSAGPALTVSGGSGVHVSNLQCVCYLGGVSISGGTDVVLDGASIGGHPSFTFGTASWTGGTGAFQGVFMRATGTQVSVSGSSTEANLWGNVGTGGFNYSYTGGAPTLATSNVGR